MMVTAKLVQAELRKISNPAKGKFLQRFFKTGKGQYAEGDKFLGINVPAQRVIAKKYRDLPLSEVQKLLNSPFHEHRFTAAEILVDKYDKADVKLKKNIASFYLKNAKRFNNWDLVDTSATYILGPQLLNADKKIIYKLVRSKNIWERRIAVLTTFHFIREFRFDDTLKLAKILLTDKHDLMHKAVGWMLREIGKRDRVVETEFLNEHVKQMPRTMLRYAIEHYPKAERLKYLSM